MFELTLKGVSGLERYLETSPAAALRASRDAVNSAIDFGYAASSRGIRSQVNLTRQYLGSSGEGNRLRVARRATEANPSGVIAASQRPVSLARYALDRSLGRRRGVTVRVKPGRATRIPSAFLVKLRAGRSVTEENFNVGLVVRLKPGQRLNSRKPTQFSKKDPNLFLLFSPSVDQVFRGVREQVAPDIERYLAQEWLRNYTRYVSG